MSPAPGAGTTLEWSNITGDPATIEIAWLRLHLFIIDASTMR